MTLLLWGMSKFLWAIFLEVAEVLGVLKMKNLGPVFRGEESPLSLSSDITVVLRGCDQDQGPRADIVLASNCLQSPQNPSPVSS